MEEHGVFIFTSESVTEGHPDKICDIVSDAVLDACVKDDETSRVACECCTKTGMIMIFGEITTSATVNYEAVIRETLRDIGYDDPAKGLDYKTVNVIVAIEEQSPDIAQAVDATKVEEMGAGDQGLMFGYATDETEGPCMPLTFVLATQLARRLTEIRKSKLVDWIRPDGKTSVTCEYVVENGRLQPQRVHTVVISAQHADHVNQEQIRESLMEHVVRAVIPVQFLDDDTIFHMNPSGRFVIGGPHGDAGLSGRKLITDTYGGWAPHGGGSFSGKDATKVDRSASYAARWVAKSLVHSKLCHRVLVQLAYAIALPYPISIHVDSYGTAKKLSNKTDAELVEKEPGAMSFEDSEISLIDYRALFQTVKPLSSFQVEIVKANFDLRPGSIVRDLQLRQQAMRPLAVYGHFGRDDNAYTWEIPKELVL